ncbi:MAG: CehA/McbA family metallohydrolase [Cyclobacteriaceae bacterium]
MTSHIRAGLLVLFSLTCISCSFGQRTNNPETISLKIDGSKKMQQIDGFGVNANTRSWNGKELEPALDLLLDSMNATIWRVIVETVEKWEEKNDNNDPLTFNWDYYNNLYETPKFQKAWDMIRYLNKRGITDNLMINFMGFAPPWMGVKVINAESEDEYVEMILSFFHYAIKTKNLKIGLIAPTNESEHHNYSEGPHLDAKQHARIIRKLTDRMDALGIMGSIRIVAPDNAHTGKAIKEFMPALMEDPVVMSRIAHFGVHSYGGYYKGLKDFLQNSPYPQSTYWVTEWNAWCNGCDDGKLGEYNYDFASKSVGFLLDLLKNGARAGLAWEGYDSYYEHHAPSSFSYWGMLAYAPETKTYHPRKNFYAIQQVSKFVLPGARRIFISDAGDSLSTVAFYDSSSQKISVVGVNQRNSPVNLHVSMTGLPATGRFEKYYTNTTHNVFKGDDIVLSDKAFNTTIPPNCIFTLTSITAKRKAGSIGISKPEPSGWFAGDIHVHRNCGGKEVLPESKLLEMMEPNDLSVISVLADMGNGEVLYSKTDLPKVSGKDAVQSKPGRIVHWDAEWHWDATYSAFEHQALGGHLVLLGLKEAHQIWDESPYKILEWSRKQDAIGGFCHFQYLNDRIQNSLNCCIPVEYPVEAALGTMDFISEDVYATNSPNNGNYDSEAAINAYYKLLNCGFRLGLAAGTDYPCNDNEPLGTLLTYVNVKDKPLTYRRWIEGIRDGRTVVSRNGHNEFLDMKINGNYSPGDEIKFQNKTSISVQAKWTVAKELKGRIELVSNGKVLGSISGTAKPGEPLMMKANTEITRSSWICVRRMDENGHQTHSAPVYITIANKPVRASPEDAQYFIRWIDNVLEKTASGGEWSRYFTHDQETVRARYRKARDIYNTILLEAQPESK